MRYPRTLSGGGIPFGLSLPIQIGPRCVGRNAPYASKITASFSPLPRAQLRKTSSVDAPWLLTASATLVPLPVIRSNLKVGRMQLVAIVICIDRSGMVTSLGSLVSSSP